MKPRLRLTTPSLRLQNLAVMEEDEELLSAPEWFDIRWDVLVDCFSLAQGAPFGCPTDRTYFEPKLPWCRVENVWLERGRPRHGEQLLNAVLDDMDPDEWHMGIGDDSLPVPGVFKALREEIDAGADVVMFPMRLPSGHYCPADPEAIAPCVVSGGQVFYRRDVVGDLRWVYGKTDLDGVFLRDLYARTKDTHRWHFREEGPELRHNQLRGAA